MEGILVAVGGWAFVFGIFWLMEYVRYGTQTGDWKLKSRKNPEKVAQMAEQRSKTAKWLTKEHSKLSGVFWALAITGVFTIILLIIEALK